MCLIFNAKKRNSRHIRRQEKVSLLWYSNIWKWYKMLSYTIRLSVTIKEYKEVSFSQRKVALTPQDIYTAPNTRCLEEHRRKVPLFFHWIMSQLISVETIGCWSHHDAWCKHWRSSSLTENNGVSRGQNVEEHSDSTRPTSVDRNPSLNEHLHHQKVIQWAWVFRRCHFSG